MESVLGGEDEMFMMAPGVAMQSPYGQMAQESGTETPVIHA
jgi:hypothetical protein